MSAASLASYVIGKLSSSEATDGNMTGRDQATSSTPRLTTVWRPKSIPYDIPDAQSSPFKGEGSLLRLLRAKSMPVLGVETRSTRGFLGSPPSSTGPDSSFSRSGSSSPVQCVTSRSINPKMIRQHSDASMSTIPSVASPPPTPRTPSPPGEQHRLTRSHSDGHLWAKRKKQLRDVRQAFHLGTQLSVKKLKGKFDHEEEQIPRGDDHPPCQGGGQPRLNGDQVDHSKQQPDNRGERRRVSRHDSLLKWETTSPERRQQPLRPPVTPNTIKRLLEKFESSTATSDEILQNNLQDASRKSRSTANLNSTTLASPPPQEADASQLRRESRSLHKRGPRNHRRAKSEPDPAAIRRFSSQVMPVSVKKLKMKFERPALVDSSSSPPLAPPPTLPVTPPPALPVSPLPARPVTPPPALPVTPPPALPLAPPPAAAPSPARARPRSPPHPQAQILPPHRSRSPPPPRVPSPSLPRDRSLPQEEVMLHQPQAQLHRPVTSVEGRVADVTPPHQGEKVSAPAGQAAKTKTTHHWEHSVISIGTPSVRSLRKRFEEGSSPQSSMKTVREDVHGPSRPFKADLKMPLENQQLDKAQKSASEGKVHLSSASSVSTVKSLLRQFETLSPDEKDHESQKFFDQHVAIQMNHKSGDSSRQPLPAGPKASRNPRDDTEHGSSSSDDEIDHRKLHPRPGRMTSSESSDNGDTKTEEDKHAKEQMRQNEKLAEGEARERARIEKEIIEREARILKIQQEIKAREEAEQERKEREREEQERKKREREEQERKEREREKRERKEREREEQERKEKERAEQEERKRAEQIRKERERVEQKTKERERAEQARKERERAEQERRERERAEQERKERERSEQEKNARELAKRERKEKLDKEIEERERAERERESKEKDDYERAERERREKELLLAAKVEQEREEREEAERERREKEKAEAERKEREALENEKERKEEVLRNKKEFIRQLSEGEMQRNVEIVETSSTALTEETGKGRVHNIIDKFNYRQRSQSLQSDMNSPEKRDVEDRKVGKLINQFTNLRDMDFEEEERATEHHARLGDGEERRMSDVAALVDKFATMNLGRHTSTSSEGDDGGPSEGRAKEAAPIPTIPTRQVPGKVRALRKDELRFFDTGGSDEAPFVRSQSLRTKKSDPPAFSQPRFGSLRDNKSRVAVLASTTPTKANLPANCRNLKTDELRFFTGEITNIYLAKGSKGSKGSKDKGRTEKMKPRSNTLPEEFFRLGSQGDQEPTTGSPGDEPASPDQPPLASPDQPPPASPDQPPLASPDQPPPASRDYDSDSDSGPSVLRSNHSGDGVTDSEGEIYEMEITIMSDNEMDNLSDHSEQDLEYQEHSFLMTALKEELLSPVSFEQFQSCDTKRYIVSGPGLCLSSSEDEFPFEPLTVRENAPIPSLIENGTSLDAQVREETNLKQSVEFLGSKPVLNLGGNEEMSSSFGQVYETRVATEGGREETRTAALLDTRTKVNGSAVRENGSLINILGDTHVNSSVRTDGGGDATNIMTTDPETGTSVSDTQKELSLRNGVRMKNKEEEEEEEEEVVKKGNLIQQQEGEHQASKNTESSINKPEDPIAELVAELDTMDFAMLDHTSKSRKNQRGDDESSGRTGSEVPRGLTAEEVRSIEEQIVPVTSSPILLNGAKELFNPLEDLGITTTPPGTPNELSNITSSADTLKDLDQTMTPSGIANNLGNTSSPPEDPAEQRVQSTTEHSRGEEVAARLLHDHTGDLDDLPGDEEVDNASNASSSSDIMSAREFIQICIFAVWFSTVFYFLHGFLE